MCNDDEITTARTLKAMEYNIACKLEIIERLLAENRRLETENKQLREENVFLEHLRSIFITKN